MPTSYAASKRRYLAAMGDAADIGTWGGIPYHFYHAGRALGFFDGALNLRVDRMRWPRRFWNLGRMLLGNRMGGYQHSDHALRRAFGFVSETIQGQELVSQFQSFPRRKDAEGARVTYGFYVDMSLRRLLDDYQVRPHVGRRIVEEMLLREADGYDGAHAIAAVGRWGAESIARDCNIPRRKVHVVVPGAMMDEALVEVATKDIEQAPVPSEFSLKRPFRLGFIGNHPVRKGLDRLLGAVQVLRRDGIPVELVAVGRLPPEFQKGEGLRWVGHIDKRQQMQRFIDTVRGFDLGCLPSVADASGGSILECLRLGIPVMGSDVGGIPDVIPKTAGFLVPPGASLDRLAAALRRPIENSTYYVGLRREARRLRRHFSWDRAAREFQAVWEGGPMYGSTAEATPGPA